MRCQLKKCSDGNDEQSCRGVVEVLGRDLWIQQVVYPGNDPHQQKCYAGDHLCACEHLQTPCLVSIAVEKCNWDGEKDNRRQEQHIQDDKEAAGCASDR